MQQRREASRQWAEQTAAAAPAALAETQREHARACHELQAAVVSLAEAHARHAAAQAAAADHHHQQNPEALQVLVMDQVEAVDRLAAAARWVAQMEQLLQLANFAEPRQVTYSGCLSLI
jgi:hypothetical protein